MDNNQRQAALDNIPEAELAKIQSESSGKVKVEIEDIIEAEFLMKFGWEAYWDIYPEKDRSAGIQGREMMRLLAGSRKVDAVRLYNDAQAAYIGAASAQSGKKSNAVFEAAANKIIKASRPDL